MKYCFAPQSATLLQYKEAWNVCDVAHQQAIPRGHTVPLSWKPHSPTANLGMWLSGLSGTYNAVLLTTAVYSVNTQTPTRWTMRQIIRTHCHKHSRLAEYTLSPRLTDWLNDYSTQHSHIFVQYLTSLLSVESEGSLTWWRTPPLMPVLSPIKHTSLNSLRNVHFNIKLYTFTSNNSHSGAGPPESLPISYTLLATKPVNQCSNPGNGVYFPLKYRVRTGSVRALSQEAKRPWVRETTRLQLMSMLRLREV